MVLGHLPFGSRGGLTLRLNSFLELKMESQRLKHRIHELRAQKAPFMQTPALAASALPSNFGGNTPPTTSSLPVKIQPPVDVPPSVLDPAESTATNSSPITRSFDAAGFQEGEQDEPAKKKVCCVRYLDVIHLIASTQHDFRLRSKYRRPRNGFA